MTIRTFVCLEIPPSEKERIAALRARLERHGARVGWIAPANVHLTLSFLGDVEQERIAEVSGVVARAAERSSALELRLERAGGFPSLARPRVLWVGITGEVDRLRAVQADVAGELEAIGFPRERRAFSPHLTIGRVKNERDPALSALARDVRATLLEGDPFLVSEIVTMRSELLPGGARYTPLARARLGSRR